MPVLSPSQESLRGTAQQVAESVLRPNAAAVDRERRYPTDGMAALGEAGLLGLLIPEQDGGRGGGLGDLALVGETLAAACASTAMCFLMHSCGCALIAAKATPDQRRRWLQAAARGGLHTTLAFSERLTGAHFYQPEITAVPRDGGFVLSGRKSFVTSGGQAQLYPVLVRASGAKGLDVLLVSGDSSGVRFEGVWEGSGMAGNSSIAMLLDDAFVPSTDLLGAEGDGMDLVFNVVAPTFLVGLAAVNTGIAQAALDAAAAHAKERTYEDGSSLAGIPAVQTYLGEMSVSVQAARQLVAEAARAADAGEATALPLVMQAKIGATEAAASVTDLAMQVGGGLAYSRQSPIERHWRDAHAGAVMAPTNDVLKIWLGKVLTGLPLF
jgi:isovaleryl-CoA dehydrogenase